MKLLPLFTPILAIALLAGCVSAPVVQQEIRYVDLPSLNTESTVELGDTLLEKEKAFVYEGLELRERITDNGIAREYIVEPGRMPLVRRDPDGTAVYEPQGSSYYIIDKTFGRKALPKNGYLVRRPNGTLELQGYYDLTGAGRISPVNPQHTVGKQIDVGRPSFRQELIYGGRVGDQIKVTYREYSGDFARAAFSQEVQYDLTTDKLIGFKGVRVEILSATNTKLVYKVLRSFPDPR